MDDLQSRLKQVRDSRAAIKAKRDGITELHKKAIEANRAADAATETARKLVTEASAAHTAYTEAKAAIDKDVQAHVALKGEFLKSLDATLDVDV